MRYIYGPVNSRRLGRSLGISLVEMKTCNFDCIFCELGVTGKMTEERRSYVDKNAIMYELDKFFGTYDVDPDVLTVTGFGEPTLNAGLPEIARAIKEKYPGYKTALLTNSSHVDLIEDAYKYFDIIMPSMNAVTEQAFLRINRPVEGFMPGRIIDNLKRLREEFDGSLELEIFICRGINDTPEELCLLLKASREIRPDKVWINTVLRHPAYADAVPIDGDIAAKLTGIFNSNQTFDCEQIYDIMGKSK